MGEKNKLLLSVNGVPLVRHVWQQLSASSVAEIVVVLGYQHAEVESALDGVPVDSVVNPDIGAGQMSSVRVGVGALTINDSAVMVCLADQPLLEVDDYDFIINAFLKCEYGSIAVPMYKQQRGNPVIFAANFREAILHGGINFGCRRLIENNPDEVFKVEVLNDHFVSDIDTPSNYLQLVL